MRLRRNRLRPAPYYGTNFRQYALQHLAHEVATSTTSLKYHYLLHNYHIFDENGKKLHIDKLLELNPARWEPSVSNELGRIAQGIGDIKGNDVVDFIPKHQVPKNRSGKSCRNYAAFSTR